MPNYIKLFHPIAVVVTIFALSSNAALASSLALTTDGVSGGFKLSTFVSGFTHDLYSGPYGVVVDSADNILVSDVINGTVYKFKDIDNQTVANNLGSTSGFIHPHDLAVLNGNIYLAEQGRNQVLQVDSVGKTINTINNITTATGLVSNPFTGNLFVSNLSQIWNLNPLTGQHTVFQSGGAGIVYDGMALSANGKTLYVANQTGGVLGYDVTTGSKVYDSGSIPGADGIAIRHWQSGWQVICQHQ